MSDNDLTTTFNADNCAIVPEAMGTGDEGDGGCHVLTETTLYNSYPFVGSVSMNALKSI